MSADFWAGYVSGAASIVIGNPLDLIKVRLQASTIPTTASRASSASIPSPPPQTVSLRNLLRGLPAPVLTYGALNALLFKTYNQSLLLLSPPPSHLNAVQDAFLATTPAFYPYWSHFTAGCIAGLATFVISTPTELIKCRTQVAHDTNPSPVLLNSTAYPYSSWSIARTIYQQSGLRGFYHGGMITSIRDAVGYGFYFLAYEASKDIWDAIASNAFDNTLENRSTGTIGAARILLCGGVAGVVTWVSIFPLDVIKTRVQTQTILKPVNLAACEPNIRTGLLNQNINTWHTGSQVEAPRNTWSITREAYRTAGIRVFFRGMTVCCVRAFIVNAVQWTVYESMMHYLVRESQEKDT